VGATSHTLGLVSSHLVVENLGLATLGRWDQVFVQNLEDILANLCELGLDLLAVLLDQANLALVSFRLFLLLDGSNDPPRRTARANDVLVGNGKEISLLDGEFLVCGGNGLHVLNHFWTPSAVRACLEQPY
jgi:hypothetical protein